jgi:hypothetical protein
MNGMMLMLMKCRCNFGRQTPGVLQYPLTPQAEYVTSLPVVAADVVNVNPAADVAGAVAGNDQGLPMLVEDDDCFAFINSLSDLVPSFDLLQ